MKQKRKNLFLAASAAITVAFTAQSANAQNLHWDGNNNTTGFGNASGTWAAPTTGTATAGWSASNVGTAVVLANSVTTTTANTLNFGTDSAGNGLGGGTITVSGTVDALTVRFGSQTTSSVTLSGGTINFAAVGTLHTGAGGTTNHNITSSITGASTSLTKTGNILTLSGANSYTGTTLIPTGTLILNNLTALGSTTGVTIGGAASATLSSSLTGITITAPITTANTGLNSTIAFGRATAAAGSITLDGAIGGNGNVIFTSPNANSGGNLQTINLGATATYAGTTTLNTGSTSVSLTIRNSSGAANVLPTTTVLSFGTGAGSGSGRALTFDLNGQNQTLAGLSNSGAVPNDRNQRITSASAATLTINSSANHTFGGSTFETTSSPDTTTTAQITGAISLVKNGVGTFTLGGTLTGGATAQGNAFTGSTTVLGGILVLGQSDSIRNSAFNTNASIAGDATNGLRTTPSFLRIGGLTGGNDFATRFTTTSGGYATLTGLTLNPNTGDVLTYSGDVGNGAGAMNLTKSGAGTQILSGTSSHTGTTSVNAGTLVVNGNISTSTLTTVASTATIAGSGTVGALTVQTGGFVAPGNSPDTLDVNGNYIQAGTYNAEVNAVSVGNGTTGYDQISVTGTVDITGGSLATAFSAGTYAENDLLFILLNDSNDVITGTFTGLAQGGQVIAFGGLDWKISYTADSTGLGSFTGGNDIALMAVPEPNVAALIGALGGILLLRRRR